MSDRTVFAWLAVFGLALAGNRALESEQRAREDRPERADLIVAADGSGGYRSIQPALDAVPRDNTSTKVILVRNGTYHEKLFIRSSHVALVGEDWDRTRIEFAELRKNWRKTHPDDWGAAVVNIGDDVTDVFIGNLTVSNNYGAIHGDTDHQFAIRSGGIATRITLVHAKVLASGGDTLSLWNTGNGMYYHADCDFEGWVDYVCPRGWCYITNSRFFGHSPTASIWHDGSRNRDQRFVIRRSIFGGIPGFALGRNNRDGQFFLLDNQFSATMADRPIYRPSSDDSYQWPARAYYANNRRAAGNFAWFADNLPQAEGQPLSRQITPAWTFQGRWDPEGALPRALPFASTPRPETGDTQVAPAGTQLRWTGARNAVSYKLAFGTSSPPPFRADTSSTSFDPGSLKPETRYFWRVDAITASGIVAGSIWTFETMKSGTAMHPSPPAIGEHGVNSQTGTGSQSRSRGASDRVRASSPWRIRIVLVGDSTVTDEIGWGYGFKERVADRADCVNLARNGRSSKSYLAEGHWTQALDARADYILIQFGHNDMPGKGPDRETDPNTTYKANLERYVDEARSAGAAPVIVSSITRRIFGEDGKVQSDLGDYAAAAAAVAASKGIPLIDLHRLSMAWLDRIGPAAALEFDVPKADGTADKTHLSRLAGTTFGSIVADELARVVPALAPYVARQ